MQEQPFVDGFKGRWKMGPNNDILKLIEDVAVGCGMMDDDGRKHTEPYKSTVVSANHKIICKAEPMPGCRVKVYWDWGKMLSLDKDEDGYPPDEGYVLTLPGYDSKDIWMSGIIHIPNPEGCEKSECDPEWIYIDRLVENENVLKIEFLIRDKIRNV